MTGDWQLEEGRKGEYQRSGGDPRIMQSARGSVPEAHLRRSTRQAKRKQARKEGKGDQDHDWYGGVWKKGSFDGHENEPLLRWLPLLGTNIAMGLLCI